MQRGLSWLLIYLWQTTETFRRKSVQLDLFSSQGKYKRQGTFCGQSRIESTIEALGHACRHLGHINEAVIYTAFVFADIRSSIGLRTTAVIKSMHNLGGHQRPAGHTKAAEESLQTALSTVDDVFGFEHYTKG